jgi:hypothetical protein
MDRYCEQSLARNNGFPNLTPSFLPPISYLLSKLYLVYGLLRQKLNFGSANDGFL